MENVSIYEKQFNYGQVKAICEVFKYREELSKLWNEPCDYEDIIRLALRYYEEWDKLATAKNKNITTPIENKEGTLIDFISEEEFAYEQVYIDRRIREEYLM